MSAPRKARQRTREAGPMSYDVSDSRSHCPESQWRGAIPMTKWIACSLLGLLPTVAVVAQPDVAELAERSLDSVVLLRMYARSGELIGTGSGFFVSTERLVTNYHVIENAHRVTAVVRDGSEVEMVGLLAADQANDLAVLLSSRENSASLSVTSSTQLRVGEPIVVLGSPAGLSGTVTNGIISALRPGGLPEYTRPGKPTPAVFQISAPISPGSSGSPVINMAGEVIGVASSGLMYGQNLNFSVPPEPLRQIIEEADGAEVVSRYGRITGVSSLAYARNVGVSLVLFGVIAWFVWFRKGSSREPRRRR